MASHSCILVGDESPASALMSALGRGTFLTRHLSVRQAMRSPGSFLDADVVVWAFPPGRNQTLEAEAHGSGTSALYVWWAAHEAEVGPLVVPGLGPCPACLASSSPTFAKGNDPQLRAWACALAALQCSALANRQSSELVAASWHWSLLDPTLTLVGWNRRHGCRVPGCVQPRSPMTSITPSPYRLTFD